MKNFRRIGFSILLSVPLFSFSQNTADKLQELNTILKQDSSNPKKGGNQSNLAVSDEGAGGSKSSQKVNQSAVDKPKKEQNSNGSGASNLAVSDEGASGPKGGKTGREASGTVNSAAPKTSDVKTPQPK